MTLPADRTSPKPFVFVLMPFDRAFDDIYALGIKVAAKEIGAYAERVDEQQYAEGILERILNQINKADVIVADMTARNPNVFYEVGYAHAINKLVVLLTQNADDIPFDLKHRPHIVYGGKISDLRKKLKSRLRWAIDESGRRGVIEEQRIAVSLAGIDLASGAGAQPTQVDVWASMPEGASVAEIPIRFAVRNDGPRPNAPITHAYIFGSPQSPIFPVSSLSSDTVKAGDRSRLRLAYPARPSDVIDGLSEQFHMKGEVPSLPSGGMEAGVISFRCNVENSPREGTFRLQLLSGAARHDFMFRLSVTELKVQPAPTRAVPASEAATLAKKTARKPKRR